MQKLFYKSDKIPIVTYRNIESMIQRTQWDEEKERISALEFNQWQIENLISNSKYMQFLTAIATKPRKEFALNKEDKLINLMVSDVNSPSTFRYSLLRVWYYLMNNFEFIVSFLTSNYENVSDQINQIKKEEINDVTGILFKSGGISKPYFSLTKVNGKVYKITTGELIVLSVIRITQMWLTNVADESIVVLSTHGIKDHSYEKFKTKMIKEQCNDISIGVKTISRWIDKGVMVIKGSKFMEKLNLIESLMIPIMDTSKVVTEIVLNTKDVKMVIQESSRSITAGSKLNSMIGLITLLVNQSLHHKIDLNEIISIAIVSDDPIQLLNEIVVAYGSDTVMKICEAIGVPFEFMSGMKSLGVLPRVSNIVLYLITNFTKYHQVSLNTYLKLKIILSLETCSDDLIKDFTIKSKWGTEVKSYIINTVIDFAYDKFVEPFFNGTFDFDLNQFDLITEFN